MRYYLKIGNLVFPTLVAQTPEEQAKGLMGKAWPPPIMSFIYKQASFNKYWMKNTPSPLDIVFCFNNKIISIAKGEPHSTAMVGPDVPTNLVLEFPYGTCKKYNIIAGSEVKLISF